MRGGAEINELKYVEAKLKDGQKLNEQISLSLTRVETEKRIIHGHGPFLTSQTNHQSVGCSNKQ